MKVYTLSKADCPHCKVYRVIALFRTERAAEKACKKAIKLNNDAYFRVDFMYLKEDDDA